LALSAASRAGHPRRPSLPAALAPANHCAQASPLNRALPTPHPPPRACAPRSSARAQPIAPRLPARPRRWALPGLLLALLAWVASPVAADDELRVEHADSYLRDGVYLVNAAVKIELPRKPRAALANGVPLVFSLDIEVLLPRDWWPDDSVARVEQRYRLSFHGLSRSYRVENLNSGVNNSFRSLDSALWHIGSLRNFPLLDALLLEDKEEYLATLQCQLDIGELPLPLRPQAYLSSQWRLKSELFTWSLR